MRRGGRVDAVRKPGKARTSAEARTLEQIPNIGKSIAADLRAIGIARPEDLKGKDGIRLYHRLNRATGARHDPCVADTFMAAVHFMDTNQALPWWHFTAQRKSLL